MSSYFLLLLLWLPFQCGVTANEVGVTTQVNPYEIEEVIKENVPGVDDCVVIGVPDETDGQRPKAFVVGQADPNDVIEFVRDTFISYMHLCAVEVVDAIPRSPSGKIMRVVLAEQQDSPFVD